MCIYIQIYIYIYFCFFLSGGSFKRNIGPYKDHTRLHERASGLIALIKGAIFKDCFGRFGALNTSLDFGWISSGEKGPNLDMCFFFFFLWSLCW